MHRKILVILVIVLTTSLFVGCNNESDENITNAENDNLTEKLLELEQKNQEFQGKLTKLEQENKDLQAQVYEEIVPNFDLEEYFILHQEQVSEILSYFSEEQLNAFAEDQWQYRLSVNDVDIPESGVFEVEADQIEITLSQQQPEMDLVPSDIFEQGQISGESFHEHILEVTPDPSEEIWRDGTIVTGYGLLYTDLTPGTEIEITITEELRARLGYETNQVIIKTK